MATETYSVPAPRLNAPHTLEDMLDEEWQRPYLKSQGAFPLDDIREAKYWPPVNRIDNVYGDRNLFCACPAIEDYA